jgi:hypothetical protein
MIPRGVLSIRRDLCGPHCTANPADPCAECPDHWGKWDCEVSAEIGQLPEPNPVFQPPVSPLLPRPWPLILQPIKLLSQPEDTGLGDIIARTIGPIGGDAYKKWYLRVFGKSCGCDQRQETWNALYPL